VLTSLHHLIDLEWMSEAYRLTRKDGAPGIDGVTAADYEANLEANLTEYASDFDRLVCFGWTAKIRP